LSKAEQKRFRSLMWEFRRDPKDLKLEEREALESLFAELPVLKDLYDVRVQFKEIFDTAPDRAAAEQQLAELRARTESLGLDFGKFWTTYDNWKTGILNYFDGRYTSAAVEGINNKARVITKRCYGVKSCDTLWNRLRSGPEPGVGSGRADDRRTTADRRWAEGRISRVLHLEPEEPKNQFAHRSQSQTPHRRCQTPSVSFPVAIAWDGKESAVPD
jgi:hypothetical protein